MAKIFKSIVPTFNRVLVKISKPAMKTASGLILTGSAPALKYGRIIAKGPGKFKKG